jgi:hypothetical protein
MMDSEGLPVYQWQYFIYPRSAESYYDALAITFSRRQFVLWAPGGAFAPFDLVHTVFCGVEMPEKYRRQVLARHPDFVPQYLLSSEMIVVRLPDNEVVSREESILRHRRLSRRFNRATLRNVSMQYAIKVSVSDG